MAEKNGAIRILIADDHPIFRDGLRRLLESESDITVVGEAADGSEALNLTRQLHPDLLLLDLAMPHMPGLEALRQLSTDSKPIQTIMLTAAIEPRQMVEAMQLGAKGIVLKESATKLLMDAIRTVLKGGFWVESEPVHDILEVALQRVPQDSSGQQQHGLTKREFQMVEAIVQGLSNKEMAEKFNVREDTVKHHLTSIFSKLGVSTRLELALFALEKRLVTKK